MEQYSIWPEAVQNIIKAIDAKVPFGIVELAAGVILVVVAAVIVNSKNKRKK